MQPSNAIVQYDGQEFETGLEDFSAEDLRMPRLNIQHKNGTFKDSLTGEEHEVLHVVVLGLIKQRVLWQPQVEDDSSPLCKSTNFKDGFPTMDAKKANENYPWSAAGWHPNDFPQKDGRTVLPCDNCRLKEWGSHPDGKKTWCSEQHTIPLLYSAVENVSPQMMALYTTQRSSITASKGFFAAIVRAHEPAYSVTARISLRKQQRGTNEFCVPIFTVTGKTIQDDWPLYSQSYRQVRDFIGQPPRKRDDGVNAELANNTQGQYAPGFQPQQNWAQPQQQPPPQGQYVPQPAQMMPQPGLIPQQRPEPVQQIQPQQATQVQPQQVVQPTAPLPANPTARDAEPDDLPF